LPDSDTFGGETNMKAVLAKLTYGLRDYVELGTTYIRSKRLEGDNIDENLIQADVVFKF